MRIPAKIFFLLSQWKNHCEKIRSHEHNVKDDIHNTLNSAYNKKMEIFLHYRWLFIKGNVFIGEWEIFDAEVFLCYSQFFIKGDFVIDGVECNLFINLYQMDDTQCYRRSFRNII